jgi:hypothetical protein
LALLEQTDSSGSDTASLLSHSDLDDWPPFEGISDHFPHDPVASSSDMDIEDEEPPSAASPPNAHGMRVTNERVACMNLLQHTESDDDVEYDGDAEGDEDMEYNSQEGEARKKRRLAGRIGELVTSKGLTHG